MTFLALIAFFLQSSRVAWVDLAEKEIARVRFEQQVAAQRMSIAARFTRTKALALADVEEDTSPAAVARRLAALRAQGSGYQADFIEELQRQAEAEERMAALLAESNATTGITPAGPPAPESAPRPVSVPAAPMPAPAPTEGARPPVPSDKEGYLLSIPKLGLVDVPVIPSDILNQGRFFADLKSGVAQAFCHPGQPCKNVIFGHSSGFSGDTTPYRRVFARLHELSDGDTLEVTRGKQTYTYVVFKKEIVGPTAMQILRNYHYEELTLFTCWPINTWEKRLVVYTKRI